MDFKKFCEENLLFGFTPPFPELTEAFYMDCFINHQLQELLYPKEIRKLPENSGKTLEKDFDYMLSSLIKRIPSYNKNIKKSGNIDKDEDVKKRMSDKLKNISIDCKKWFFSILYSKNPDMCRNLAPIITFILVDSYPFFEDKLKTSKTATQFDLYGYILECLNGKHQEAYLFSLLRNSPPSKKRLLLK